MILNNLVVCLIVVVGEIEVISNSIFILIGFLFAYVTYVLNATTVEQGTRVANIDIFPQAQNPEINDQFSERNTHDTEVTDVTEPHNVTIDNHNINENNGSEVKAQNMTTNNITRKHEVYKVNEVNEIQEPNIIVKVYNAIENSITKFLASEKVIYVLHNIGTCVVNGVMDLITFYLPAPMIPLIASAAGMLVPFEPVVTLREKMPVTSYRRAFDSAVNSFMGTFEKYKTVDDIEDPYMTRRFNRRFINDERSKEKKKNVL